MWLILSAVREAIEGAKLSSGSYTDEQISQYEARSRSDSSSSKNLKVSGGVASIQIHGALTNKPDFFSFMFAGGNPTYPDIISALNDAAGNDDVKEIELDIDSPGGTVAGLFEAIAAMQSVDKPITAKVSGMAASAAYALASQADTIVATSPAAMFGSIGIVVSSYNSENRVTLTSSKAPKKAPDASTKEGASAIVEELDALHELFVEAIATGRGTEEKNVNKNFGQGGTLLAKEALKRGMIDKLEGSISASKSSSAKHKATAQSGGNNGEKTMDLNELKSKYPALYSEVVTQERERATAHLIMGEASGCMDTAIKAVREGSEMTALISAEYNAANMKRLALSYRSDENTDTGTPGGDTGGEGEEADAKDVKASGDIFSSAAEFLNVDIGGVQ